MADNLVESRAGTVKMPYSKAVLDMMELLNYVNLSEEFSRVEGFAVDNIKDGKFSLSDCLKGLADCSLAGLQAVLEALLAHLGENFVNFSQMEDVCLLSQHMVLRLLQEKEDDQSQTIHRFRTLMAWLSGNSTNAQMVDEALTMFDFDHFTVNELASDVRDSGLYWNSQIIGRMKELFEVKNYEVETLKVVLKSKEVEIEDLKGFTEKMSKL